jgi:NOL1/NOP2/fmu family ribosome biogenesis protein
MTFYVPPGTVIRDGTGTVSLSELEQDDVVLIKYVDNPTGTPKVVSMSLNKSYPEF